MTTVAIIQARYDSKRLPGKVLGDLAGRPALAWTVRAAKAISAVDEVIVATSDEESDAPIADWCAANQTSCYRGSKDDVLARVLAAAEHAGASKVLRLTADCPFLDPAVCAQVLLLMERKDAAYATNAHPSTWPDGLDCEAMTIDALRLCAEESRLPSEREHVTRWLRANPARVPQAVLVCPIPGLQDERWTLDTAEDLQFLQAVADRLPANACPAFVDILQLLDRAPELRRPANNSLRNAQIKGALLADFETAAYRQRSYTQSVAYLERAESVIPTGSQTFSKSKLILPPGKAPLYASHGLGARIWDVDGNEYVDLVSALLPVILGYADPDVDAAIRDQLNFGITHSLPTSLETGLAERIVRLVPSAEMVRFGKNGTDATSGAVRVARAFTSRDRIAICGYHGWQDWYVGTTTRSKGVPEAVASLSHLFSFNDLGALRELLERHPGEFAAVILEPVTAVEPNAGYLQGVRDLADEHGAVLIFDEVITGFRVALGGAQQYYGVTPDLTCLGKALGNGMPISALAGRADIMAEYENIFFSGTFGGETLSLAAAIATLDKLERDNVIDDLWEKGQTLAGHVDRTIAVNALEDVVSLQGLPCWKHVVFNDHEHGNRYELRTYFMRRMMDNGVLLISSHNLCGAFSEANEAITCAAYERALADLGEALQAGPISEVLDCPPIQPVFALRAG